MKMTTDVHVQEYDPDEPPLKNTCINPITKQWDQLSALEFRRLKNGYAKDHPIPSLLLALKESKREYMITGFGLNPDNDGGLISWLVKLYDSWPDLQRTDKILAWPGFIKSIYYFPSFQAKLEHVFKLQVAVLQKSIETLNLQQQLEDKRNAKRQKFNRAKQRRGH